MRAALQPDARTPILRFASALALFLGAAAFLPAQTYTAGATIPSATLVQLNPASLAVPLPSGGTYSGISLGSATSGQTVNLTTTGIVSCLFENATTPGDLVVFGTTTFNDCRDSGQTANGAIAAGTRVLGFAANAVGAGAAGMIVLGRPDQYGTLNNGSGGTPAFNAITPGSNTGALTIGAGGSLAGTGGGVVNANQINGAALPSAPTPCLSTNALGQPTSGCANYSSASHYAYGDSLTTGTGATGTCNGALGCYYASLDAYDENATLTNEGVSGSQACDMTDGKVLQTILPGLDHNPFQTMMIGVNDANVKGAGAYETAVYIPCHRAAIAWLATTNKLAVNATSCTPTGTWTTLGGYEVSVGTSATNGSTLTCSITTAGGPIYGWYRLKDSDGGTGTYAVDALTPVALTTATTPAIATQNGGTTGWGLIRVPIAAGTHSVVFTVTSSTLSTNTLSIAALATVPAPGFYNAPMAFVGGVIRQQNDAASAATAAYNADALADVNLLASDGLDVYFANVRNYICTSIVGGSCYGSGGVLDMSIPNTPLHPSNPGYNEIKQAFQAVENFVPSATVVATSFAPISVGSNGAPASAAAYSYFDHYTNVSSTLLSAGACVYVASPNADCIDLGYSGAEYSMRVSAPNTQKVVLAASNGGIPTLQSNFTDGLTVDFADGYHIYQGSVNTGPTLSACGTSPSITVYSSDYEGEVTTGTGATGCSISFKVPFTGFNFCSVTAWSGTATASSKNLSVLNVTASAGAVFDYHCGGK